MQEVPVLQALLQFVRFGLPWDFGRTITIAHGDGRAVVSPPLSSPVFQRQQWSHEKLRRTGSRSEPGDDTANEKRRANSVQLRRSIPVQAGAPMKKHMAESSTAAIFRDARLRRPSG